MAKTESSFTVCHYSYFQCCIAQLQSLFHQLQAHSEPPAPPIPLNPPAPPVPRIPPVPPVSPIPPVPPEPPAPLAPITFTSVQGLAKASALKVIKIAITNTGNIKIRLCAEFSTTLATMNFHFINHVMST